MIQGDIEFTGGAQVDGIIRGTIKATGERSIIRVTAKGKVEGNIFAPVIIINGRVSGSVYSYNHLELGADAHIEGDVHYQLMEMAMGAEVNGRMMHESLGVQESKSDALHCEVDSLAKKLESFDSEKQDPKLSAG